MINGAGGVSIIFVTFSRQELKVELGFFWLCAVFFLVLPLGDPVAELREDESDLYNSFYCG